MGRYVAILGEEMGIAARSLRSSGVSSPTLFQKEQTMYELGLIFLGVAIGAALERKAPLGLRWIFSQFGEEIKRSKLTRREKRALKE